MPVRDTFELDDKTTWPDDVLAFMAEHDELFTARQKWEQASQRRYDEEHKAGRYTPQAHRSTNPHDALCNCSLDVLVRILKGHKIKAWHCTRLTPAEQEVIAATGMSLPNPTTLHARISQLVNSGELSNDMAERLLNKNQADEANRVGMIWFVLDRPGLRDEMGVGDLFRLWGGEALYNSHDGDSQTGPLLRRIGVPCIVEAVLPVVDLGNVDAIARKMVDTDLANRGVKDRFGVGHGDRTRKVVPASDIFAVIPFADPRFLAMTSCEGWDLGE